MISIIASSTSGASSSVDYFINLNTGDTLPVDVNLYANAIDSDDSSATLSYSWHLLRSPAGSSALLDSNQVQNPILQNVDVWGDYRLFCIATNTVTGVSSETDPVKAPNSAFVQVRVRSANLGLIKPAAGERDWFTYAYQWVDAIEAFDAVIDDHEERITIIEARLLADTFASLSDTNFGTLLDGQVAQYDDATGKWVNQTLITGSQTLLLADTDTNFTVSLATQRVSVRGTTNINVDGSSITGGIALDVSLADDVDISGSLSVGGNTSLGNSSTDVTIINGTLNANGNVNLGDSSTDVININADANHQGDVVLNGGQVRDDSHLPYLIIDSGSVRMSRSGSFSDECDLMTRCDQPTTSARGGVLLTSDKWNGYNSQGKIPSVHILHFSQQSEHTVYTNSVADAPNVDHNDDEITANQTGASQVTPHEHILFHNSSGGEISIEEISIVVMVGGDIQGQPYIWELTTYLTTNDLLSQTRINTGVTVTLNQNVAWSPAVGEVQGSNLFTIPAGGYFGFRCTQSAKVPGHRVIANVTAVRMI